MTFKRVVGMVEAVFLTLLALFILVVLWSLGPGRFVESKPSSKRSRDQADMRTMAIAIASYSMDNGRPPLPRRLDSLSGDAGDLRRAGGGELSYPSGLTTPISYITSYFHDAFVNHLYAYWIHGEWIVLAGPGPDKAYNLSSTTLPPATPLDDPWPFLKVRFGYYPTNGTYSTGDILRVERIATEEADKR